MPENEQRSALLTAFTMLEKELGTMGEERRENALRALFRLNKEIGRIAAISPGLRSTLRPLQLHLNGITIGLKQSDSRIVEAGLNGARRELEKLKADLRID